MPKPKSKEDERRRARRTPVRDSFNLFLALPELTGMARTYLRDISAVGVSFHSEIDLGLQPGQAVTARLYLNPGFYLPLDCRVVRAANGEVALEFVRANSEPVLAIAKLQDFFTAAEAAGVFVEG